MNSIKQSERIAKRIASAGLCSRREAEKWISLGRVCVDGITLNTPAFLVTEENKITVDGKLIPKLQVTRVWRYYKPTGILTTHKDPHGRNTVFDSIPKHMPRVISVGRLDIDSEGLLLLTTSGKLARKLELPSTGWKRRYRVRALGNPNPKALENLSNGITISGIKYGPIEAKLDRQQGANAWLTMSLQEGKNREIRRICEHLGLKVNRLIRAAYGPFQLGNLKRGQISEISPKIIREQLGE